MAVDMLPRLKVVADEDRVEADLLGKTREPQQLTRRELLRRCLVSELDHRTSPGWRRPMPMPWYSSQKSIDSRETSNQPKQGSEPCISELPCLSATSVAMARSCANSHSSPRPKATK